MPLYQYDVARKNWWSYFSDSLRLVGFLCIISSDTFSFELLSCGIFLLVIITEEIDVIVIGLLHFDFLRGSRFRSSLTGEDGTGAAGAGEGGELSLIGLDVLVPAGDIGVSQILRKSLEDGNVGLRWGVTDNRDSVSSDPPNDQHGNQRNGSEIMEKVSAGLEWRCLVALGNTDQ